MRRIDLDVEMRTLAERQHQVIARAQARRLGASRAALQRRTASAEWELMTPLVLRLAGSSRTFQQGCMAAVLDAGPGAVVSTTAAAVLWQIPGFRAGAVHVSRRRGSNGRKPALATLHEPRFLPEHHVAVADGIPVTTVARTIFDLAGCLHPLRTERALDNALNRKLVRLDELRAVAIELLEHGRAGSAVMRELLADRHAGYIPPASGLEARFLALLVAAGLELPDGQVDLGDDAWIGRVDFVNRRRLVVYEIDSDRHHTTKLDRESDARRDEALRAAGFRVVRITERDLIERPGLVVAMVRASLQPAGRSPQCSGSASAPVTGR